MPCVGAERAYEGAVRPALAWTVTTKGTRPPTLRRLPRRPIIGACSRSPWWVRERRGKLKGAAADARGRPVHHSARDPERDPLAEEVTLPIRDMAQRHTGLTKPVADSYAEAARVCLDRHHRSPTDFDLDRSGTRSGAVVAWRPPDARTRGAWAKETDATEAGVSACALAAVELTDGLAAVRRAETGTGADYYVAPPGVSPDDLEDCLRLEVSGVDRGPEPVVRQRLNAKLRQGRGGQ